MPFRSLEPTYCNHVPYPECAIVKIYSKNIAVILPTTMTVIVFISEIMQVVYIFGLWNLSSFKLLNMRQFDVLQIFMFSVYMGNSWNSLAISVLSQVSVG